MYKGCMLSKQPRNAFKSLGVLHNDVCRLIEVASMRVYKEIMDLSYLKENRNVVYFQKSKKLVKNQSGKHIKILRIDGGNEYISRKFEDFCYQNEIIRKFITPYTPLHNNIAQRRILTILNMVISMIKSKQLSYSLCGEEVRTIEYILNRAITKRLQLCIQETKYGYFRIFGSICYKHIHDEKKKKLDNKSEAMIMVGFHLTRAYRLFYPITKKIIISKDVIFDESMTWN
ncbi:hypothetical protein CR513_61552, partial [Mucuna pruriens]